MSQTLLFSIGVCVFALTIVGAMVYGRYAFTRFYDAQVASEAAFRAAAAAVALAGVTAVVLTVDPAPTL